MCKFMETEKTKTKTEHPDYEMSNHSIQPKDTVKPGNQALNTT